MLPSGDGGGGGDSDDDDEELVEEDSDEQRAAHAEGAELAEHFEAQRASAAAAAGDDDSDDDYAGPQPLPEQMVELKNQSLNYGGAMMPGEGEAIAQYVQQNLRIPRRGEVGWTGDEIEDLETQGCVCSLSPF